MSDILVFKEVNGCFMLEEDMSMKDRIFSKAKDIASSKLIFTSFAKIWEIRKKEISRIFFINYLT